MTGIHKNIQRIALSITAAVCMAGIPAFAHSYSHSSSKRHEGAQSPHSKAMVRRVQLRLRADGFYHGKIDGISGPQTHAAIRAFQKDNQLDTTGRLNGVTLKQLRITRVTPMNQAARSMSQQGNMNMPYTSSSNASRSARADKATIEAAQRQLKANGMYSGPVNGVWNSATQTAVRDYQQKNQLNVTGQLDQQTLSSLGVNTNQQNQNQNQQNPQNQPNPQSPQQE